MTDCIDLLAFLRSNKRKLSDVKLHGYITREIEAPYTLSKGVTVSDSCVCIEFQVMAVTLDKYSKILKDNEIDNPDHLYFVNGAVACFIDKRVEYPDWFTIKGNMFLSARNNSSLVAVLNYSKSPNGQWGIFASYIEDLKPELWVDSLRVTKQIFKSNNERCFVRPKEVSMLPAFSANEYVHNLKVEKSEDFVQDFGEAPTEISQPSPEVKVVSTDLLSLTELKIKSPICDMFNKTLATAFNSRDKYIEGLLETCGFSKTSSEYLEFLLKQLNSYMKSKRTIKSVTGRSLLKDYISFHSEDAAERYNGVEMSDYIISIFDDVAEYMLESTDLPAEGKCLRAIRMLFGNPEIFYASMIGKICGLEFNTFMDAAFVCTKNKIRFSALAMNNPYAIVVLSPSVSFQDVELLAVCLGKWDSRELSSSKNTGLLYDYTSQGSDSSTIFLTESLLNAKVGVTLTKAKYTAMQTYGTHLSEVVVENVKTYINQALTIERCSYNRQGWVQVGGNYVQPIPRMEVIKAVNDFSYSGVGCAVEINGLQYITSTALLKKEVFIYEKIYKMSEIKQNYEDKKIDELIEKFESQKGFKLEPKQKDAVRLVKNRVALITGSAGSGKTTVSECIVYVLKNYNVKENVIIKYAAPTGKAAKRLQEVVGSKVHTMHSMFMIGQTDDSIFEESDNNTSTDSEIYIFDENAMVTLDLMYRVLLRISNNSRVFFIGDINQLPPIGKGLPFKNFLRFVPSVKLTVSKRSQEKSGVTYNSNVINDNSTDSNWKELMNTSDFKIINCQDENIQEITSLLCKHHLGKISLDDIAKLTMYLERAGLKTPMELNNIGIDDIQIVSPLSKPTYPWGTYQMNNALHDIFNPNRKSDEGFIYRTSESMKGIEYRVGDRVIHNVNMYNLQWYSDVDQGIITKAWGNGIMNGEVGKIVGILPTECCEFCNQIDAKPEEYIEPQTIRNDAKFVGDSKYFVVVEYFDSDSGNKFYILYQALVNVVLDTLSKKTLMGKDLGVLQLFYAGTVHKMQGSQAKLVICLLGTVTFRGFVTRNMIYTAVTRASEGVYLIGNVSNSRNSQLSNSRRESAGANVKTVGEMFYL